MATRKKSRSTRSRKRPAKNKGRKPWLKWLSSLLVLAILGIGGYTLYLSKTVRVKFEGKRWAIPARVYARPLELYAGAEISAHQLQGELAILGYRKVAYPKRGAEWSRSKSRFLIRTRAFEFWDEKLPAQQLAIRFSGNSISSIRDVASEAELDLVRLEPPVIGSIYPAHNEDRVLVRREDLPKHLVDALLAVEDRKFYEHHGIDPEGILRAVWANLKAGKTVQGGSTLTQQLVKNFYLTRERSLRRKSNEALMALILDARYEKDEILEAYANEIFLGQDGSRSIHGFGLAAHFYFSRPVNELSLPETALLVGMVKGPSYYNPRRYPERALNRRNLVLELMAQQGFINQAQLEKAKATPLDVTAKGKKSSARYPAFVDLVRRQLKRDYREEDLTSEGLRIFTTIDPMAQQVVEKSVQQRLADLEKQKKFPKGTLESAVVLVSRSGGEVRALVGGRDAGLSGFNRALDAVRPIGSLIKPVVYLTALSQPNKYNLVSRLNDRKISLKGQDGQIWEPDNYDNKEHGDIQLHEALAQSYNLATVHLGLELGLEKVVDTLRKLGVERPVKPYPSLLLGATSLPPLEVAQMYQTLAAGGFRAPLRAIREVTTAAGQPLQRYPLTVSRVVDPAAVFLLNRNLTEVVRSGTGRGLKNYLATNIEVAGKTGTTNNLRDSWFAGFSDDLVGVVWVGRDDNQSSGLTGSSGALTVWGSVMKELRPASLVLVPPEEVGYVWIEESTGLLSAERCKGVVAFPFIKGSEPSAEAACANSTGLGDRIKRLFE